jgi:lipopolysaccharide/colanic/teichoic acid biosynthesis glycosyltransferase
MVIGIERRDIARFPAWKRALDIIVGVPALLVGLPIIGVAAIGIRASADAGPVFHRAIRVGEGGRPFTTLKLRTMRVAGVGSGAAITAAGDPRVTRLGRVLRKTKVDELPQLWNVLRGEMSLVGPRPEDPRFVDWTRPLHVTVFTARPGITGPAQIAYRHEESMLAGEDVERAYAERILPKKLELDAAYLQDRSLTGDLAILARTVRAVLR